MCDLDLQSSWTNGTSTHQGKQFCQIIFRTVCINVEAMARASLIYEHLIIWTWSVNVTFNLLEKIQMASLFI